MHTFPKWLKESCIVSTFLAASVIISGCTSDDISKDIETGSKLLKEQANKSNAKSITSNDAPTGLTQYNKQASKYPENIVELKPTNLTQNQKNIVSTYGTKSYFNYTVTQKGLPYDATAVIDYNAVRNHASDVIKRPNFKSTIHVAGEYKYDAYNKIRKTWYSQTNMKSNNQIVQLKNYRGYLYNKSHLIAWSLGGNMETENLILGTRAQNVGSNYSKDPGGMSYIETFVRDAIYNNPKLHVFYQAIPVYKGHEIVPRGVYVRAYSINDNGKTINKAVYTLNTQDGITINYNNGTFKQN